MIRRRSVQLCQQLDDCRKQWQELNGACYDKLQDLLKLKAEHPVIVANAVLDSEQADTYSRMQTLRAKIQKLYEDLLNVNMKMRLFIDAFVSCGNQIHSEPNEDPAAVLLIGELSLRYQQLMEMYDNDLQVKIFLVVQSIHEQDNNNNGYISLDMMKLNGGNAIDSTFALSSWQANASIDQQLLKDISQLSSQLTDVN